MNVRHACRGATLPIGTIGVHLVSCDGDDAMGPGSDDDDAMAPGMPEMMPMPERDFPEDDMAGVYGDVEDAAYGK